MNTDQIKELIPTVLKETKDGFIKGDVDPEVMTMSVAQSIVVSCGSICQTLVRAVSTMVGTEQDDEENIKACKGIYLCGRMLVGLGCLVLSYYDEEGSDVGQEREEG